MTNPVKDLRNHDLILSNSRAVRKLLVQLEASLLQLQKDVDSLLQRGKKR